MTDDTEQTSVFIKDQGISRFLVSRRVDVGYGAGAHQCEQSRVIELPSGTMEHPYCRKVSSDATLTDWSDFVSDCSDQPVNHLSERTVI